jgi:S1-C subfamily serine protease
VTQVLALLCLIIAMPAWAADWPTLVPGFTSQVPRVQMQRGPDDGKGTCSAVVFEVDADGVAHALTAAHCVTHDPTEQFDLTLNGRNARVAQVNRISDLAIVQFRSSKDTKAITLATTSPPAGSEVAVAGFAFGVDDIVVQFGRVAQSHNRETKTIWINGDIIFGDSGGAIIDEQGRLVGLTSSVYASGPAHIGAAVRIETVLDFLDDYKQQRLKAEKK